MGVLDDAIREHLELKRKHGASEGEVERQEQEALGAPRREPVETSAEAAAAAEEVVAPEEPPPTAGASEPAVEVAEPAAEAEVADPAPDAVEVEPDAADEVEPESAVEPEPESVEPEGVEPGPEPERVEPEDEVEFDFDPSPPPPAEGDTPPRGFEPVEDEPAEPVGDGEGDVLEETPDFLEETPEHDRLWFEQKPPRDFDFDDEK